MTSGPKQPASPLRRVLASRWTRALAALLILLSAIVWYQRRERSGPEVVVAPTRVGPLTIEWSAVGYVESRTAQVATPEVGRIAEVAVREGDSVRAGEVLARLVADAPRAGAEAQAAAVRAAAAQADAARMAAQEAEAVQPNRVARAEAEVAAAGARHEQSVAALRRSRDLAQANLAAARAQADAARHEVANLEQGARPEEIAQAEAEVAGAEATATRARAERARRQALLQEGAIPRRASEEAEEAAALSEAAVRRTQAALALLRRGPRPEEIAAARARLQAAVQQVAAAEAQVEGLRAEERRVEEAAAALRSARALLSETRAGAAQAAAARDEARAALARTGQARAALRQARAGLGEWTVRAPFAGVVGRRFVDPGDIASPARALFSIAEVDRAWVTAEVDVQDLAAVREGQPVSVTFPAYPGRALPGQVARLGGEAIPQTEVRTGARILRVRISVPPSPAGRDADRPVLKPGMEVDVAGRATLLPRAVLVPNDAVLTDATGPYVFVVAPEAGRRDRGRAQLRRVEIGYAGALETEIRSGLDAGQQVVVSGKEGLTAGRWVKIDARRQ